MIIWLTGMPCSGKTTIARLLKERLNDDTDKCYLLDGDDLRSGPFAKHIGFSSADRENYLMQVGFLAKCLDARTPYVVCAFVSPSEKARQVLPIDILVYTECSKEECIRRDVKGMWKKAMEGTITGFTGWDAEYEKPLSPDLVVYTETQTAGQCVNSILSLIERREESSR